MNNDTVPTPNEHSAPDEYIDTVVVGGGQAGLSTGYHLARRGRRFVVLEANARLGDNWRCHWDSLRLYSPASRDGLPGMAFPASPRSFPTKDEVAEFLERYATVFDLPVRLSTRVRRIDRLDDRYVVDCGSIRYLASNVVVATGTHGRTPTVPEWADAIDPAVSQLHSSEYRNPGQLQPGPVLVVGASHSGADIAFEVAESHPTILCGRDTGQMPLRIDSRRMKVLFPIVWFAWGHALSLHTPIGRRMRGYVRHHGAPLLRVRRADLAARGIERVTARVCGVRDGLPVLDDGRIIETSNVVWCTGFHHDFSWITLPVFDDEGWPRERRGVVTDSPGLYFTGLTFQSSFRSMLIGGAGDDARFIVRDLTERRPESEAMLPA